MVSYSQRGASAALLETGFQVGITATQECRKQELFCTQMTEGKRDEGLAPVSFFLFFNQQWFNTRAILIWGITSGTCYAKRKHALTTPHTYIQPNSISASDETLYSREERHVEEHDDKGTLFIHRFNLFSLNYSNSTGPVSGINFLHRQQYIKADCWCCILASEDAGI